MSLIRTQRGRFPACSLGVPRPFIDFDSEKLVTVETWNGYTNSMKYWGNSANPMPDAELGQCYIYQVSATHAELLYQYSATFGRNIVRLVIGYWSKMVSDAATISGFDSKYVSVSGSDQTELGMTLFVVASADIDGTVIFTPGLSAMKIANDGTWQYVRFKGISTTIFHFTSARAPVGTPLAAVISCSAVSDGTTQIDVYTIDGHAGTQYASSANHIGWKTSGTDMIIAGQNGTATEAKIAEIKLYRQALTEQQAMTLLRAAATQYGIEPTV